MLLPINCIIPITIHITSLLSFCTYLLNQIR
uniref:Uncharacterized protein n=1 Tax=Rhizophora mucronata TaxID=61149 RepID=A0A2P2PEJ4_RHIMU